MATFILVHSHRPVECRVAFAAWRGFASPLRHATTAGSCAALPGDADVHRIWWTVEATDEVAAFAQLPPWVAERTNVERVGEVAIP
jgi:hypothetical protein